MKTIFSRRGRGERRVKPPLHTTLKKPFFSLCVLCGLSEAGEKKPFVFENKKVSAK
jgi:hypothetical protein